MADENLTQDRPESNALITRRFNDVKIGQRLSDGYLNATAMCKANGKEWSNYRQNGVAEDFLDALERSLGIPRNHLVTSITKGPNAERGTWVHPQVAYHLAMWCSPTFAVKVTEWLLDLHTQGFATIDRQQGLTAKQVGGIVKAKPECRAVNFEASSTSFPGSIGMAPR